MALNISTVSVHSTTTTKLSNPFVIPRQNHYFKLFSSSSSSSSSIHSCRAFARTEETEGGGVTEEEPPGSFSSARTQLGLLEQLTSSTSSATDGLGYESDGSSSKPTIREQLAQIFGDREGEFSIPLGKNLKKVSEKFLTISQRRNIRRQEYLDEVSQRNDSVFFATIGAFVILPPVIILGIAILTGYVQLFP